jgi:hypothetical protein
VIVQSRLPVSVGRPDRRRTEMNRYSLFQSKQPGSPALAPANEAAIYTHPTDVTNDPKLTTAEKRVVLPSWISDARAVENAPSLRQLDSGAVVEVDAILQALVLLDEPAPDRAANCKRLPLSGHRRSGILKWLSSSDDDDEPPPAPAGFGIPFRPIFVAAHARAA